MNEFTINELILIEDVIAQHDNIFEYGLDYVDGPIDTLHLKIKSMIENYPTHCEHSGVKLDDHKYHLQQQSAE